LSQNVLNARLAADYLRAKGLKTFAFYGDPEVENLQPLRSHFQSRISEQGLPSHHVPFRQTGRSEFARKVQAADWLRDVPKPAGVLTCEEGDLLLEACEMAGLAVPGEVTILEIDREGMLQECLGPHLFLVIQDTAKSGYAAAALLGQMMNAAEAASASPAAAGNAEAETRASHDKLVLKALCFIRENACGGITVKDVLSQVPLSRRVLEHRFRKLLGRTPHEEIIMTKLKRVKRLLSETHLSLIEIADKTGFYHTEYLSVAFKREVGLTPREYRRRHQQKQAAYF
jgi:LacI family transcriptional regulator